MAIPWDEVGRAQVLEAMESVRQEILQRTVAAARASTAYCVVHPTTGWHFPPKYVLGRAVGLAHGGEDLGPQYFSGGEETNRGLRALGFTIDPCEYGGLYDDPANTAPSIPPTVGVTPVDATESGLKQAIAGAATTGQGPGLNAAGRKAVELLAMSAAAAHFRRAGWRVDASVHTHQPYDLRCTRPGRPELHVEVKGTTTSGARVLLTRNEVAHARATYPDVALFVLAGITLGPRPEYAASGGRATVLHPWRLDDAGLEALGFEYTLPAS